MEAAVSLVIFDSQGIDVIRNHVPAAGCAELASGEYQPRAATPLLDAVGHGVAVLDRQSQAASQNIPRNMLLVYALYTRNIYLCMFFDPRRKQARMTVRIRYHPQIQWADIRRGAVLAQILPQQISLAKTRPPRP